MPIVFSPGMDQGTDPAVLPPGGLTLAENLRPAKNGRMAKRSGDGQLPVEVDGLLAEGFPNLLESSQGQDLIALDGRLCVRGRGADWVPVGELPLATPIEAREVQHPGEYYIRQPTSHYDEFTGLLAVTYWYSWGGSKRTRFRVFDTQNWAVVFDHDATDAPSNLDSSQPAIVPLSSGTVLWLYTAGNIIYANEFSFSTLTLGSQVAMINAGASVIASFSAAPSAIAGRVVIAWSTEASADIGRWEAGNGTPETTVNLATFSLHDVRVNVANSPDRICVVWTEAINGYARARVFSHDFSTVDSGTINLGGSGATLSAESDFGVPGVVAVGPSEFLALYSCEWDSNGRRLRVVFLNESGIILDLISQDEVSTVDPVSRPFQHNGRTFFFGIAGHARPPGSFGASLQRYVLYEIDLGRVIPHIVLNGQAILPRTIQLPRQSGVLQSPVFVRGNLVWHGLTLIRGSDRRSSDSLFDDDSHTAVKQWEISLDQHHRRPVDVGGVMHVPGGLLAQWDGSTVTEVGSLGEPVIVSATPDTSGALTSNSSYQHTMVWQWFDALGRRHFSAPAAPVVTDLAGGEDEVDLVVSPTGGASRARWTGHVYRTLANGSVFYRVTPQSKGLTDFVSAYSDTLSDANASVREVLYTEGGVLSADPAPASRFGAFALGRLWLAGLFARERIRCSTLALPGLGLSFPEQATHWLDFPNPVTGLASLEDSLIVFTENDIYVVSGDGPDDTGLGGFAVRQIATDVGCTDWRSVVSTSLGVFFQSRAGIMLLPRLGGAAPVYVGQAVADILQDYPYVVAAREHAEPYGAEVDFLLWDLPTSPTKSKLVSFSLRVGATPENNSAWTVDTTVPASPILQVGSWGGKLALAAFNSYYVRTQSPGQYLVSRLATGELTPGGIGALWRLSRVWLHVIYRGPCVVSLAALYDGKALPALPTDADDYQSWELNSSDYTAGELVRLEWRPRRQEAERVRLFAADTENTDPASHGVDYVSATLELEPVGPQQIQTVNRR